MDNTPIYNLAAIRKLLLAAFTPKELRRFSMDRPTFKPVVVAFSPDHGLDDMLDEIVDYCETRALWPEFLNEVAKEYPRQYERFSGELRASSLPGASQALLRYVRVREFATLIENRTKRFVGREFVFEAINDLMADLAFPSGYIVVVGEPGIGKTSLLAQMVKQKNYVHHFNSAPQGIRSSSDFLGSVCAQLIIHYGLNHSVLPPEATKDSGFLCQLLDEVVVRRDQLPAVVLVDALDEAEDARVSGCSNRLCLPPVLPQGVYFVVTVRPDQDRQLSVDRCKEIYLDDQDPRNMADVSRYVEGFLSEHYASIFGTIAAWGTDEDTFVDTLVEKSEGNFMYLVHILDDILDGRLTPKNLDDIRHLPLGLKDYYQRHWRAMHKVDVDRFEQYYEPVVCILATVREPVTLAQLAEWTNLPTTRIKSVLDDWHEFLNVGWRGDGKALYRVYHASFQDFLQAEVGLEKYHAIIAETALIKIPGFLDGDTQ